MLMMFARRVAAYLPVLAVVIVLAFLLTKLTPGDPAVILAGDSATPEQIQQLRHDLGEDKPAITQLWKLTKGTFTGDLGNSIYTGQPVGHLIWEALPVTLSLAGLALAFGMLLGIPAGLLAALRRGRLVDHVVGATSAVGLAIPAFVFGFILVIPLALQHRVFPATGYAGLNEGLGEWLKHLALPALALSLSLAPEIARQVRGAMVDTLEQDFIRTKRASGLAPRSVIGKHALRNSAIPVVTVIGLQAGRVLGGAVVVESIFVLPGLGSLAIRAIQQHDYPAIQGIVLVSALVVMTVNLLVDLSYVCLNPRLRS